MALAGALDRAAASFRGLSVRIVDADQRRRIAALTGVPAWEIFKPWAITSITIAVAVALVLWWRMIRFEYALMVTTATAAVTLAYGSPEPYSAMITVLLPPVLVLTLTMLRADFPSTRRKDPPR